MTDYPTIETETPALSIDPEAYSLETLTPETIDLKRTYTLDDLLVMPGEALEELWLACPERPFYEAALKQAVDDTFGSQAMISDIDRLSVIDTCILYYTGQHPDLPSPAPRIPALQKPDGSIRWFKVSDRIRERLFAGLPVEDTAPVEKKAVLNTRALVAIAGVALTVLCLIFVLLRGSLGAGRVSEADLTATAAAATAQAMLPPQTLTPTPLALENIDRPIREGDDLRGYYPVLLELAPAGSPSRVFPVQQKEVEIAEWAFDPDPDVASAVLGLVVRPVLGIPYTPDNAAFLSDLTHGDEIRLRMSTGQVLTFRVSDVERVNRQEVSIFDQSEPGIAIILLQDTAPDRLVVYGEYLSGQEAPGQDVHKDETVSEGLSTALGDSVILTVLDTSTSSGPPLSPVPAEWLYLLVDLEIQAQQAVDTSSLSLELVDISGARYAPVTVDGAILRYPALRPVTLEAEQTLRTSAAFLVPRSLVSPVLRVQMGGVSVTFALDYVPAGGPTASDLDVAILSMVAEGSATSPRDLVVSVRLFNPQSQPITVLASEIAVVFSPVVLEDVYPVGPLVQAGGETLPLVVEPGQAQDIELRFAWNGDPYVGLQIGGYRFIAVLR